MPEGAFLVLLVLAVSCNLVRYFQNFEGSWLPDPLWTRQVAGSRSTALGVQVVP